MKSHLKTLRYLLPGFIAAIVLAGFYTAHAKDRGPSAGGKTKVEVQLTESFYRALRAEDGKTYSTGKSDEYLRQIAVASKYAVETNLKVIENQQRIIQLLEAMQKQPTD